MKKILALLLTLVLVFSFAACGAKEEPAKNETENNASAAAETPAAGDLNVGVFYYAYSDTYISSVRTALDNALTAAGISYTDYDGNGNQTQQTEQIQTALTAGCNLLIVNMVTSGSSDTAKAIMDMAGSVPVIFFNRAVESDGEEGTVLGAYQNICFIGTDAPEAGHMQGKMVGDYVLANYDALDLNGDGSISYAMFKGDEANVEAIYRTQYGVEDANAILTAAGKPALVYFDANNTSCYQVDLNGQWSAAAALEYMNTNLAQYNEANGTGKTIPVFGVDATASAQELIAAGKMTGTVKQDAEGMANAIAAAAAAVGQGASLTDAVATAAASNTDMYTIAEGIANKLFVAYAPFTA